jgi:hypothetical protein
VSLQSLQLDDLNWTEMVDAIRTRIAANSNGEWTMHGPLDPGVTLLELFAYLFEQRLYWLDQVPEPLVRAMLALLDEVPLTTASANTLLAFRSLQESLPQQVFAGTVFDPRDPELLLPYTILESVTILPVNYVGGLHPKFDLITTDQDYSADLSAGRLVPLLPADGNAAELQITIWLDRELVIDERQGEFNLLFDLDCDPAIAPEWVSLPSDIQWFDRTTGQGYPHRTVDSNNLITDSGHLPCVPEDSISTALPLADSSIAINDFIAPDWNYRHQQIAPPAKLKWHYSTGVGTKKQFSGDQITDATGGLRRSGLVRINIPPDWEPAAAPADGLVPYAISISCASCTFSSPPRLRRLIPNTVIAQHRKFVEVDWLAIKCQVAKWLRLPGQELQLPVEQPEPLEKSVHLHFFENDGLWYEWQPTDHFYHHGPEDRVFVVDRPRKRLLFGNGLTGRIPVLHTGSEPLTKLCYFAGGGNLGNIGELVWTSKETNIQPVNPVPGIGGTEAETMTEAKARVGANLTRRERAITAEDFEWLAINTPGIAIARAYAAVGYHPGFPCHPVAGAITVFVVPEVPRESGLFESGDVVLAPKTDPGALAEVTRRIDARRLITSEVYIRSVPYRAVHLEIELQGIFAYEDSLQTDIALSLTQYLDPLVGGNEGDGWPFGGTLRPSSLIKQIQLHIDDGVIVKRVAIALDSGNVFEDCNDVVIGEHELVFLQGISLSIDRKIATQGSLR